MRMLGVTRAEAEAALGGAGMRYRLQCKAPVARPNILGNHSFPVHTYRWKDIAASDDREALEAMIRNDKNYRIEDTKLPQREEGQDGKA